MISGIFGNNKSKIIQNERPTRPGPENADDVAKNIVQGEIILQPNEYIYFWNAIQDKGTCSRYLARIIIMLINFEKDPIKTEKSLSKKVESVGLFIAILLNTIRFIDLFVGFDRNHEAFVAAMTKYKQEKKNRPSFRITAIDAELSFLDRRGGQKEVAAIKMLVDCSTLESDEEIRLIGSSPSTTNGYNNISIEASHVDFPFTFTALSKLCRVDVPQAIFDEVLNHLELTGNSLSSMAAMQGRTLALMFILRELLTISPTSNQVWLNRACEVLFGLYKWPTPYGVIAKEVLDFVSLERRSPGCHLRDRILSENPLLRPTVLGTDGLVTEVFSDNLCNRCSMVFLFLDQSQPICRTHKYLLLDEERFRSDTIDSNATPKHLSTTIAPLLTPESIVSLRRDIINHIIEMDFYLRDKPAKGEIQNDPLDLLSKSDTLVIRWYCRALAIVEKAKSLPATSVSRQSKNSENEEEKILASTIPGGLAKMYRESKLAELLQEICPGRVFSPRRSSDAPIRSPRKVISRPSSLAFPIPLEEIHAQSRAHGLITRALSDEHDIAESDEETETPPKPQTNIHEPMIFGQYAPSVPNLTYQVYEVNSLPGGLSADDFASADRLDTMTISDNYNKVTNQSGYVEFVHDTSDLLKVITTAFEERKELSRVRNLHNTTNSTNSSISPRSSATSLQTTNSNTTVETTSKYKVKIVLMGSNIILHRFLCAYVALLSQLPDTVKGVELEIFLVPVGKNKLGTFLARSDKWYRRHIYDSFKGPLGICPQYPSDMEYSELASRLSSTLPVVNLRKLLQDYVRQAKNAYSICIFEVLCWAASEERASMDLTASADDILTHQSPPDIVIPFMMQVEIGFRTQIEQFRMTPNQTRDILSERDPTLSPIELTVSYVPSSMSASDSHEVERSELSKNGNYATLSFNNFPMTSSSRDDDAAERNQLANAPHLNFLVMNSQTNKGQLSEGRKKNIRSAEGFLDFLNDSRFYDPPQPISAVKIDVTNPRERFHILVDGCVYGPFRRIVIRSCQVGTESSDQSILTIPVMTYLPIATI